MTANVFYLTGGTTGSARIVEYNGVRWERSVAVKAKLLAAHGVDANSRVAVCHPFSPWAIGQVHVDGALRCRSDVLPLGLSAVTPEMLRMFGALKPTHVCGGARHLIRMARRAAEYGLDVKSLEIRALFVAGERLEPAVRSECETLWNTSVVDVYGMAEFDALGIELPEITGLCLVDDFEYSVERNHLLMPLEAGLTGELAVRMSGAAAWHSTGDIVTVLETPLSIMGYRARVHIQGRKDLVVHFADGSAISELQVAHLAEDLPEVSALQIQVSHGDRGDVIRALCVVTPLWTQLDFGRLRNRVININVDVADGFQHGVITDCILDVVSSDAGFFRTQRGKRPLLVRMN